MAKNLHLKVAIRVMICLLLNAPVMALTTTDWMDGWPHFLSPIVVSIAIACSFVTWSVRLYTPMFRHTFIDKYPILCERVGGNYDAALNLIFAEMFFYVLYHTELSFTLYFKWEENNILRKILTLEKFLRISENGGLAYICDIHIRLVLLVLTANICGQGNTGLYVGTMQ